MWGEETLPRVYNETGGYCSYCPKKLAWKNYGAIGRRGAWEVDHIIQMSGGVTDHINNLFPACVQCNGEKGTMTLRQNRKYVGFPF